MSIGLGIGIPFSANPEGSGYTPPTGPTNGILLEDGTSFLLVEDDSYLVQE